MKLFTKRTLFNLIDHLVPSDACIVEAGAFDGTDTKRLAQWRPKGHVHAFEPVPEIFDMLTQTTYQLDNVTCYPFALSDTNATKRFYLSEHPKHIGKPFQAGSLCVPTGRLSCSPIRYPRTTYVATVDLDKWAAQHNIDHIDLLWLDVQGHALDILKAAHTMIRHVSVLYVEVEFIQAYEGQPTYLQVVDWLSQQGFKVIGKDFKSIGKRFFGNLLLILE